MLAVDAPMTPVRSPSEQRDRRTRSRLSNGLHKLDGVKGTSSAGRRFRDLIDSITRGLNIEALSETEKAAIRNAAGLTLRAEALQSKIAKGVDIDDRAAVRLINTHARAMSSVSTIVARHRLEAPGRPKPAALDDVLGDIAARRKAAARAGAPTSAPAATTLAEASEAAPGAPDGRGEG